MDKVLAAFLVGFIATLLLDGWQWFLKAKLKIPPTNWRMVGRWVAYIPKGKFIHEAISGSLEVKNEVLLGWVFHYGIGIMYAWLYLVIFPAPDFINAVGFGLATLVAPWFILQPGMGLGVFASKAPKPIIPRLHSFSSHFVFGFGLYFGTIVLGAKRLIS